MVHLSRLGREGIRCAVRDTQLRASSRWNSSVSMVRCCLMDSTAYSIHMRANPEYLRTFEPTTTRGTVWSQIANGRDWGRMNSVYRYSNIAWPLRPETPRGHSPRRVSPVATGTRSPLQRRERKERRVVLFGSIHTQIPCDLGALGVETAPVPQPAAVFLTLLGAVAIILARKG